MTGKSSILLRVLILLLVAVLNGKTWQWESSVDLSWIQDDNVLESTDSIRQTASSARLMTWISGLARPTQKCGFGLEYQGGLEGFQSFSTENRMIHHIRGNGVCFLNRWLIVNGSLQFRNRRFLEIERGYSYLDGALEVKFMLPYGSSCRIWTKWSTMNWLQIQDFNFVSNGDGILLHCAIHSRLNVYIGYDTELFQYKRLAYDYINLNQEAVPWVPLNKKHKDLVREIHTGFNLYSMILIRLQFAYQWRISNSYGYEYERPRLELMIVKSLPWQLTLRFYARYQKKIYQDPLDPLIQVNPDAEDEENRYLLADLIRDLTPATSLRFRFGKYENESPFRNLYYDKSIISLGITQKF